MNDSVSVTVDDAELRMMFKRLPEQLSQNIADAGRKRIGPLYLKAAREAAPVDTGDLKKSLRVKVRLTRWPTVSITVQLAKSRAASRSKKRRSKRIPASTYIWFVEKGTGRGIRPNPFRAQALARIQSQVHAIIEETVKYTVENLK